GPHDPHAKEEAQDRSEHRLHDPVGHLSALPLPGRGPNPALLRSVGPLPHAVRVLCAIASRAGPQPRPPPKRGAPAPRRPCSLRYRFPGGAPTPPSSEAWGPCPTPAVTRGVYPAEKRNSCRCNYVGSGTMNRMSEHDAIDLRRADRRPHTKIDWLDSHHSFSFGHHYDPTNVGHGLLLVNNDDIV